MRLGSLVLVACAAVATIVAAAAFGTDLAQRHGVDTTLMRAGAVREQAATSSVLPLSRRVDSTVDRYTYSAHPHTPLHRMTGAQKWLSSRARPLVAYDSDPRVSLYVRGWEQAPSVSAYVNATGVNLYDKLRLRQAAPWLMRRAGQYVHVDGWAMLDIRQPAARHWWLYGADGKASCTYDRGERGALDLIACGYTGLWLDNLLTRPGQWFVPNPGIDDASWGAGLVALVRELRAALPDSVPFTVNAHWTDLEFPWGNQSVDPSGAFAQVASTADQLVVEGGAIDRGIDYASTSNTPWSYRRLLAFADAMHGLGAKLQWEKTSSADLAGKDNSRSARLPSCQDRDHPGRRGAAWHKGDKTWKAHVRTAAFNGATALLTAADGDSVGDMCEYPGRGWRGYGVDLGAPLAIRNDTGTAITRMFAGGFVAVNPGRTRLRITLPDGHRGVNLASTAKVVDDRVSTTFAVPARTALVVRYTG